MLPAARTALVVAATLLPLSAAAPAGGQAPGLKLRCEIALGYAKDAIARYGDRRLVFSLGEPDLLDVAQSGWWGPDSDRPVAMPAPPAELVDRVYREGNGSAARHCRPLRRHLRNRGIAFGARAERAVRAEVRRGDYDSGIVSVSLPVVSADGRQAIVAFSHSGAGASLKLLERQADGGWRVVAEKPLGVY